MKSFVVLFELSIRTKILPLKFQELTCDLEAREIHFTTILDQGRALQLQHPDSNSIEEQCQALESQWSWLSQLALCLEVRLKHATEYYSFFAGIKGADACLKVRADLLYTKFAKSKFDLDEGQALLKGMEKLNEEINEFNTTVKLLQKRAQNVVPLKKPTKQSQVQSICDLSQNSFLNLEKGERCTIIDELDPCNWRVRTERNLEGTVPGACLLLLPPDQEAIEAAESLVTLLNQTAALWRKNNMKLRQNVILATIKVVKSWKIDQFLTLDAQKRKEILRALNEDADKLLAEGESADPQLRRIQKEVDEVNLIYEEFEKQAKVRGETS